jgi:hypothetical protein
VRGSSAIAAGLAGPQGQAADDTLAPEAADAIEALLDRRALPGGDLHVELRELPDVVHPLSGETVATPPLAVLWQSGVPLGLLIHEVAVLSRSTARSVREALTAAARAQDRPIELVRERQLWRLLVVG